MILVTAALHPVVALAHARRVIAQIALISIRLPTVPARRSIVLKKNDTVNLHIKASGVELLDLNGHSPAKRICTETCHEDADVFSGRSVAHGEHRRLQVVWKLL